MYGQGMVVVLTDGPCSLEAHSTRMLPNLVKGRTSWRSQNSQTSAKGWC